MNQPYIFVLGEGVYGDNLDCGWKISTADATKCIELEFLDFDVEVNDVVLPFSCR